MQIIGLCHLALAILFKYAIAIKSKVEKEKKKKKERNYQCKSRAMVTTENCLQLSVQRMY